MGNGGVVCLRCDGVELAEKFLGEEVEFAAYGFVSSEVGGELGKMAVEAGEFFRDVGALGEDGDLFGDAIVINGGVDSGFCESRVEAGAVSCDDVGGEFGDAGGNILEGSEAVGLLICYFDDMLLMTLEGDVQKGLSTALSKRWKMSTEVKLTNLTPMVFLGLEIERDSEGNLLIGQSSFVKKLLTKHGLDIVSKPIAAVTGPPTAARR